MIKFVYPCIYNFTPYKRLWGQQPLPCSWLDGCSLTTPILDTCYLNRLWALTTLCSLSWHCDKGAILCTSIVLKILLINVSKIRLPLLDLIQPFRLLGPGIVAFLKGVLYGWHSHLWHNKTTGHRCAQGCTSVPGVLQCGALWHSHFLSAYHVVDNCWCVSL